MIFGDNKLFDEVKDYFACFEKVNNYFVIKMVYNSKWIVETGEFDGVKVVKSTGKEGEYFYTVKSEDKNGIDNIMKMCVATKNYNIELREKAKIYKEKSEELKGLIFNTPLKKLANLSFTFKKPKKKVEIQEEPEKETEPKEDEK